MSPDLKPGISYVFDYTVPDSKTVPRLYPEWREFGEMPEVFATGFLVGLMEGACQLAIKPYLDWPREQSLGTHVSFSHLAATPPGLTVRVHVEVIAVEGRRCGSRPAPMTGTISSPRVLTSAYIIDVARFNEKVSAKRPGSGTLNAMASAGAGRPRPGVPAAPRAGLGRVAQCDHIPSVVRCIGFRVHRAIARPYGFRTCAPLRARAGGHPRDRAQAPGVQRTEHAPDAAGQGRGRCGRRARGRRLADDRRHGRPRSPNSCPLGYAERPGCVRVFEATPAEVLAVRFTPTSAFAQTPGPRAGHATRRERAVTGPPLDSIRACLEGIVPSLVATCAADGVPNLTYVSHVHYVDRTHVALSFQFFNKTRANILANPRATVFLVDPHTAARYVLRRPLPADRSRGRAVRADEGAPGGHRIAHRHGRCVQAAGRGRLRGAGDRAPAGPGSWRRRPTRCGLLGAVRARVVTAGLRDRTCHTMLDDVLAVLEADLGITHSMVMLIERSRRACTRSPAAAMPTSGVGSEIPLGHGIIGVAAREGAADSHFPRHQ